MLKTVEALFDGTVFRPTEPIALAPNTRVRMTIETVPTAERETVSFLRTTNPQGGALGCVRSAFSGR